MILESSGFGESEEGRGMVAGEEAGEAWLLSLARGTEGVCCLPTLDPYH